MAEFDEEDDQVTNPTPYCVIFRLKELLPFYTAGNSLFVEDT
jgi:hypothetical protein